MADTIKALEGLKFIKKCRKCGRELPLSQFHLNKRSKDGHKEVCKDCVSAYDKKIAAKRAAVNKKKKIENKAQEISMKTSISNMSDSELFAELKRRGYTGELHFSKVVNL